MERPCIVTERPIDTCGFLRDVSTEADGAVLLFLGVVRNENEGRAVGHLEYEAYPPMAEATLREIVEEAEQKWKVGRLAVIHRYGRLEIGEVSVAIAVAAPHRGEAYSASRYVIEELKKRVPIWKREGYLDGSSDWVRGTIPEPATEEG